MAMFFVLGLAYAITAVIIQFPIFNIVLCALASIFCFVLAWLDSRKAVMIAKYLDLRSDIVEVSIEVIKLKEQSKEENNNTDDPADTGVAI